LSKQGASGHHYRDQPRAGHEGMLVLAFIGRISSYAINRRNCNWNRGPESGN
jgi:hypothetical protein